MLGNRKGNNGEVRLLRWCFVGLLFAGLALSAPARAEPLAVYPDGTMLTLAPADRTAIDDGRVYVLKAGVRHIVFGGALDCYGGPGAVRHLDRLDYSSVMARYPDGGPHQGCVPPQPPPAPTTTTAPPPAAETREDRAVAWARARIGESQQPDGKPWNGWCDRFVANAYGRANSGYNTAYDHWLDLDRRGLTHRGDRNVPFGTLAFYGPVSGNSAGHVMISIGNGRFITTAQTVREADINFAGNYVGWAWANPEWGGR